MGMFKARPSGTGPELPIDQVVAMKTQGYSNNQIIQTLQRDGYTSSQIFDAISQSEMQGSAVQSTQMADLPPMGSSDQFGSQPYSTPNMPLSAAPMQSGATGSEEMIEAIIDERWNELVKDINKVIEWKVKADSRLTQMEQQINDMKDQFDKLHNALIGKIGEYDKNMLEVGAELQAMEKVFSKVLPQFVDNVNELSRITDKVKTNNKSKSKKTDDD
jgi:uncharacterized protein YhaN